MDEDKKIEEILAANEPAYSDAAGFTNEVVPFLREVVESGDSLKAAKAAYFSSLLTGDTGMDVVEVGLRNADPEIRAAAASGLKNLTRPVQSRLFEVALGDIDQDVRKAAIRSIVAAERGFALGKLRIIEEEEEVEYLKKFARRVREKIESGEEL